MKLQGQFMFKQWNGFDTSLASTITTTKGD